MPRNWRRAAMRTLGTIVPLGRCAVHAAGIDWSTGEFEWVRNSRVLVATLPRSRIPMAKKTASYAPDAVRFSQPAASSGGLLNVGKRVPKFEPPGAKPQPSSERRFSSPYVKTNAPHPAHIIGLSSSSTFGYLKAGLPQIGHLISLEPSAPSCLESRS
jgi:hypothetical protein